MGLLATADSRRPSALPALADVLDIEPEWEEWYSLSPAERWSESQRLWTVFLDLGGSPDPEPDSQSPFNAAIASGSKPAHGRAGLRVVRRGGV